MQVTDPLEFFAKGTNGKGILLIHGMSGAPAEMRLVGRHLNRRGYTVYAPLLAGHGRDMRALQQTSWEDWLVSATDAAERLAKETSELFAAGICVGGKLGLLAGHQNPGLLKAVAIYSPCFLYDGWNVPFYQSLLARFIGPLSWVPFLDRLSFAELPSLGIKDPRRRQMMEVMGAEGVLDRFPGKGMAEMHRLSHTLKKQLPQMRTPTLILHAREDDLSAPRNACYIRRHIGAPSELHWVDDSYHMIHIDRQYRQVADCTADYFEAGHAAGGY
jgi:carboxylesterase